MANALTLGTVQLGMDYGVSGKRKPSEQEAKRVLNCAIENEIHSFDTAAAYGNAETTLGDFLSERGPDSANESWFISTKFLPNSFSGLNQHDVLSAMERQLRCSEDRMGRARVGAMLLHSEHEILIREVRWALSEMAQTHPGVAFGVSAYDTDIALTSIALDCVNCVQIPASALDHRMLQSGFFDLAQDLGKAVYVRSLFLQGLLFMNPDSIPAHLELARKPLSALRKIAITRNMSIAEICIAYAKCLPGNTSLVVGCRSAEQLQEDVDAFSCNNTDHSIFEEINETISADESIVMPSLWSKGR